MPDCFADADARGGTDVARGLQGGAAAAEDGRLCASPGAHAQRDEVSSPEKAADKRQLAE